jgi:hypothetical protein
VQIMKKGGPQRIVQNSLKTGQREMKLQDDKYYSSNDRTLRLKRNLEISDKGE